MLGNASRIPSIPDWENPLVLGINKRLGHAPLRSHHSITSAAEHFKLHHGCISSYCGGVQKLSGCQWDFKLYPNPMAVPPEFSSSTFEPSEGWSRIQVPYSWECAGHGIPIYTNFVYPIPLDPPFVPKGDNPTGCYLHRFVAEEVWLKGNRAFLQFDGVDSAFYCWLNGQLVGFSKDSRLPAEFDVTDMIVCGSNLLAVQVMRWSDATYLEDQDMWRLSGIHRDVSLLCKPAKARIADFKVTTPLWFGGGPEASAYQVLNTCRRMTAGGAITIGGEGTELLSARLDVEVRVAGDDLSRAHLKLHLFGPDGGPVMDPLTVDIKHGKDMWFARDANGKMDSSQGGDGGVAKVSLDAAEVLHGLPLLWSAEQPYLYTLVMELVQSDGADQIETTSEFESCQVGFRHTEVLGARLLHNGRPVMLRGVNRHEFDPRRGKALTEEDMIKDVVIMKRAGFNAVRCSHYPNHDRWYEICSLFGLYVVDEVNLETHGFDPTFSNNETNPACQPEWLPAILDRAVRMHARDKNHACIIMWSLGNEAGYGAAHDAMAAYLRRVDPTRPIHYEGGGSRTPATDVVCPMYARLPQLRDLAGLVDAGEETRPIMLCEYAHSMGNSTGNLAEYWQLFKSHPSLIGGFIWDWVDQSLIATITNGQPEGTSVEYWAVGGDFGDSPNDAQFCCNGLLFPDKCPKPALAEAKAAMACIEFSWTPAVGGAGSSPVTILPGSDWGRKLSIRIDNHYDFLSTDHVVLQWRLVVDGTPVPLPSPSNRSDLVDGDGVIQVDLPPVINSLEDDHRFWSSPEVISLNVGPRSHAHHMLSMTLKQLMTVVGKYQSDEAWLEVRAVWSEGTQSSGSVEGTQSSGSPAGKGTEGTAVRPVGWNLWAGEGHVIAEQQLRLPRPSQSTSLHDGSLGQIEEMSAAIVAEAIPKQLLQWLPKLAPLSSSGTSLEEVCRLHVERRPANSGATEDVVVSGPLLVAVISGASGCLSSLLLPSSVRCEHPQQQVDKGRASEGSGHRREHQRPLWDPLLNSPSSSWRECLKSPLRPCLWRALTDNDRGGAGGTSYGARWAAAGLDRMQVSAGTVVIETWTSCGCDGIVEVRCRWTMRPSPMMKDGEDSGLVAAAGVGEVGGAHWFAQPAQATGLSGGGVPSSGLLPEDSGDQGPEGSAEVTVVYRFHPNGVVAMDWTVDATGCLPAPLALGLQRSLPRVGVTTSLAGDLVDTVTWMGCGPHESYPDRKTSAPVRQYTKAVRDMHVPYVFPQESGGRADVRWAMLYSSHKPSRPDAVADVKGEVRDDDDMGLAVCVCKGSSLMQMNVSRFSAKQLHQARHDYELNSIKPGPHSHDGDADVHLTLDHVHMGVGGDDSWSPSVHAEYLVPPAVYSFSLALSPCVFNV